MANYKESAFGEAIHVHVNRADLGPPGKNATPTFKVDLALEGQDAIDLAEEITTAADAAFEAFKETDAYAKLKPKVQRELKVYYPFEHEEDDAGDRTGRTIFDFRQTETLKLRDGTSKVLKIGIYDAKGKPMDKPVKPGSTLRVKYSMRDIPMVGLGMVGVRLDFMGVQVTKLGEGTGGGGGFGAVAGYEDDGVAERSAPDASSDGDY